MCQATHQIMRARTNQMNGIGGGARPSDFAKATTDQPGALGAGSRNKTRPEVGFHHRRGLRSEF